MSSSGWIPRCFHNETAPAPAPSGLFEKLNARGTSQLVSCPVILKEVRFNSSWQTSFSVIYKGTDYTISLIPTSDSRRKNKLESKSTTEAIFYFPRSEEPGIKLLSTVLKLDIFAHSEVPITVRFNECAEISESLCPLQAICGAQTIIINKNSLTLNEAEYLRDSFYQVETVRALGDLSEIDLPRMFKFKKVYIQNGLNLNLDELAYTRSAIVEVMKSNLKTSDLNRFLNGWIQGHYRSLRQLTIKGVPHDEKLLSNIEAVALDDATLERRSRLPNDVVLRFASGKNIKARYGPVATVTYTKDEEFLFYVWRDIDK